jgi:RNA polymerase sigma factor (sigma-70 family)
VEDWLPGLRRGDAKAFDAVYAHYHRRIYDFLYRMSGRRELAEDLFQETWLKLARHATRLAEQTDLGAWLFTVARNAFRSHRRWVLIDLERRQRLALEPAPSAATPEARGQLAEVERALGRLREADREVLLLVAVEGMEQERVAAVLGLSYDALRQRLSRARAQLAAELAPAGEGTGT